MSASPARSRGPRPIAQPTPTCRRTIRPAVASSTSGRRSARSSRTRRTGSFSGRYTKRVTPDIEGSIDFGYYQANTSITRRTNTPSGGYFTPDGVVHSQTAATQLGATHPDNPYFGTAARLAYNPFFDIGTPRSQLEEPLRAPFSHAQGDLHRLRLRHRPHLVGSAANRCPTKTINWRVEQRAAESDGCQRRYSDSLQSRLRGAAGWHGLAHRRERGTELGGVVQRAACR